MGWGGSRAVLLALLSLLAAGLGLSLYAAASVSDIAHMLACWMCFAAACVLIKAVTSTGGSEADEAEAASAAAAAKGQPPTPSTSFKSKRVQFKEPQCEEEEEEEERKQALVGAGRWPAERDVSPSPPLALGEAEEQAQAQALALAMGSAATLPIILEEEEAAAPTKSLVSSPLLKPHRVVSHIISGSGGDEERKGSPPPLPLSPMASSIPPASSHRLQVAATPTRRSPRFMRHMDTLLQLSGAGGQLGRLVSLLDWRELLGLSKASKSLQAALSKPEHVSQLAEPIKLRSTIPQLEKIVKRSAVLRHAPIELQWVPPMVGPASPRSSVGGSSASSIKGSHGRSSSLESKFALSSEVASLLTPPQPEVSAAELKVLMSLPNSNMKVLDASARERITPKQWNKLLAHTALHGLQVLKIGQIDRDRQVDPASVKLIADLPSLHTLSLLKPRSDLISGWLAALPGAPSLTALQVSDSGLDGRGVGGGGGGSSSLLDSVSQCPSLRRLWLTWPSLYGLGRFAEFFAAPNMAKLQHLTIDEFNCAPIRDLNTGEVMESVHAHTHQQQQAGEAMSCEQALTVSCCLFALCCFSEHVFGQAFRHLPNLRVLHLRRVAKLERLLAACIHCKSLQRVLIECAITAAPGTSEQERRAHLPPRMQDLMPLFALPLIEAGSVQLLVDGLSELTPGQRKQFEQDYAKTQQVEIIDSMPDLFKF